MAFRPGGGRSYHEGGQTIQMKGIPTARKSRAVSDAADRQTAGERAVGGRGEARGSVDLEREPWRGGDG